MRRRNAPRSTPADNDGLGVAVAPTFSRRDGAARVATCANRVRVRGVAAVRRVCSGPAKRAGIDAAGSRDTAVRRCSRRRCGPAARHSCVVERSTCPLTPFHDNKAHRLNF